MEFIVRVTMGQYNSVVLCLTSSLKVGTQNRSGWDPTRTGEGEEGGWSL